MASTALATLFDWWWPADVRRGRPGRARARISPRRSRQCWRRLPPARSASSIATSSPATCSGCRSATGIRRIGVLDFQGAAIGHPAYDLASLLQDARRDIPPAVADALPSPATWRRVPNSIRPQFRAAYAACAAQRHLRVAGQWVRLARRDGRPGYLVHGPRTWRLLEQAVREPAAAPLAAALDRWIPPDRRGNPPGLAA